MNIYQLLFLILLVLPPIISIMIDNLTLRMKNFDYLEWSETIIPIYLLESLIILLVVIYVMLGAG